jgi:ABC-type transport system involved in Fe-S cluster assembly fused permease/ATPase subunit
VAIARALLRNPSVLLLGKYGVHSGVACHAGGA